jgi:hypothetical protein
MKLFPLFLTMFSTLAAQTQTFQQLVYDIRNPATASRHFREALEKAGDRSYGEKVIKSAGL